MSEKITIFIASRLDRIWYHPYNLLLRWKCSATLFENQITCMGSNRTKTELGLKNKFKLSHGEFDPGSELTLVVCLSHASRTRTFSSEN